MTAVQVYVLIIILWFIWVTMEKANDSKHENQKEYAEIPSNRWGKQPDCSELIC